MPRFFAHSLILEINVLFSFEIIAPVLAAASNNRPVLN
jgi:hypothetical protein